MHATCCCGGVRCAIDALNSEAGRLRPYPSGGRTFDDFRELVIVIRGGLSTGEKKKSRDAPREQHTTSMAHLQFGREGG